MKDVAGPVGASPGGPGLLMLTVTVLEPLAADTKAWNKGEEAFCVCWCKNNCVKLAPFPIWETSIRLEILSIPIFVN
jgi:hypothetical protein